MNSSFTTLLSGALVLGWGLSAFAQTPTQSESPPDKNQPKTKTTAQDQGMGMHDKSAQGTAMNKSLPQTPALASQIIGMNVVDSAGDTIAEIKDLVICDSGEVVAVVERDDNEALIGLPLSALTPRFDRDGEDARAADRDGPATTVGMKTPQVEEFTLKGDRTVFDRAPTIKDDKLIERGWLTDSIDHFDDGDSMSAGERTAARAGEVAGATGATGAAGKTTMGDKDTMGSYAKPACVKKIIGEDVKGTAGDGIGDVKDVAINLRDGEVAYAIVSTGGVLGMGDSLHAVAFDRLTVNEDSVTIPMTKDGLSKLPSLDLDRLPVNPTASMPSTRDMDSDRRGG